MKSARWFIGIVFIFFLCTSNGFAQMPEDEICALLNKVNCAGDLREMCAVIESGRLDILGYELFGYTGGCSDTARTADFIMGNREFRNEYELAENYVFSCIVNRDTWAFAKEYCDNGLLINICGLNEGLYRKLNSGSQTKVVMEVLSREYNSIADFRAAFNDAVIKANVNYVGGGSSGAIGGGSSGGGSVRSEAILLDKDELPAETASEVSKLRYLGWSYSGTLITAVYDSLGRMKSVNVTDYDCEKIYADIPVKTADGDSVKAMLLESLDEMSPRTESITINAAENKNRVRYTECSVESADNSRIDVATEDGIKYFLALSGGMYAYLGHRVGITSVGAYILDIKDMQSYDTVTLRCGDIDSVSVSGISAGEAEYPISAAAKFFENGYEAQFYIPEDPFEIILSKPAGSNEWDTVNILRYTSEVVAYIGDGIYTENGYRYEPERYPEIIADGEIKVGSVVSYCEFKAYISNETVYGKAEFTDDGLKIGERTFRVYNTVDVNTNYDMYTAYLDVFGNVAKLVPDKSVYDTCIITKVYNEGEKTYADIVGGERILIDCEVIYCGLRIAPEKLPHAAAGGILLYAKILDSDEKKVIITEGETMQMEYYDGMLSSKKAIAERGTPMCLYSGEKYMSCVLERGILNNYSVYQCTVFFDEDNKINPAYVCVNATTKKLIIITDADPDNGIISGYCGGKYVTFKCDFANSDDIFACISAECIGDEIISYKNCGFIGSDAVGWVIKKGSGYIVCGNPEEYEIIKMPDDVSIYLYDGNSLTPAGFSDIIADGNASGYGSYVRYMYKSGNNAKIIVLDN